MPGLDIRLSGTIEVSHDGVLLAMPGRRVRALLTMLALSAGRVVPVDTLARGIWDDDPPERVRGSLQTSIGRLRRTLGADAVRTEGAGYVLDVPGDSVDLLRFAGVLDDAATLDELSERTRIGEALREWQGLPFGDAPSEWIERNLAQPWVERYLQAVERRADLDIRAGEQSACVTELAELIEQHPLRETLWARLLTALDADGRTAEALRRYEELRIRLAGELGVDPTPDVQRIYYDLLSKEAPSQVVGHSSVPRQLPAAVGGFTGRADELHDLDRLAAITSLIALHGPGGVGKSALAVHWARRISEKYPDGQLFVGLRGYGPGAPMEPLEALEALLRGLGVDGAQLPPEVHDRSRLLRERLADLRMLLVLDDAHDVAQVRPLLPGGDRLTVVTSRSQLRGLVAHDGAGRVAVEPMSTDDAVQLLASRSGIDVTGAQPAELTELAALCGRLPLALTVAAERGGRGSHARIADVNEQLRNERERLDVLTDWADDPLSDVRAVLSWSYEALDPDSARMFRLLALHPDSRVSIGAAGAR